MRASLIALSRRTPVGRGRRRAGLLPVPAPFPAIAIRAVSDRRQLRRRVQLLPPHVQELSTGKRRPGVVDRLSRRRHQLLDPALRAHQDARQPASGREAEPPRRAGRRRRAVRVPVHHRSRMRARRSSPTKRSCACAQYLLKGGFLWAGRLLGRQRPGSSWEAQLGRVLSPNEYPIVDLTPEHPIFRMMFELKRHSADSVHRVLAAQRRRDVGARLRQRGRAPARRQPTRTAG